MKHIEPEVKGLQGKHKGNKEELARKTMELYRERGVNLFPGCLSILVQFPIIIALYWVFLKGWLFLGTRRHTPLSPGYLNGSLLDTEASHSFVHMPRFSKQHFSALLT